MSDLVSEKDLFSQALDLPEAARAAFLARACAGDQARRARIEDLLHAHDAAGGFLDAPLEPGGPPQDGHPPELCPGGRIGHYRLLEKIGEGGWGVVYRAGQEEPVRRIVALKVLKPGMDTRAVIARFEAERQALAMMDHPNIARVFDAGATPTGHPFFVMELVEGVRITDYCDEHHLGTAERLALFSQVCHAVQHAHQKGIIHRDLKPSNILVASVDGAPACKVIDFGIARAAQGRLPNQTAFTAFEKFAGTPAYMSPEQIGLDGAHADTRSDVYSLGVLLYELLTGRPPFDPATLAQAGLHEIHRIICEVEPPRPSTRLGTLSQADRAEIARLRSTAPARLSSLLRGDLEWIALRCLEKSPARRYETADALAKDITRHLAGKPVDARAPSTAYLLGKSILRHRFAYAGATLSTSALIGVLLLVTSMYQRERTAREAAETAERHNAEVVRFVADVLRDFGSSSETGPSANLDNDAARWRAILDMVAAHGLERFASQPELDAEFRSVIGRIQFDLGRYELAESMLRSALARRKAVHGPDHARVAQTLTDLGIAQGLHRRWTDSLESLQAALAMNRRLFGPESPAVAASWEVLALAYANVPDNSASLQARREALAIWNRTVGPEDVRAVRASEELGWALFGVGETGEAEEFFLRAQLARRRNGTHLQFDPLHKGALLGLVSCRLVFGDTKTAESLARELVTSVRAEPPPNQLARGLAVGALAEVLSARGDFAAALPLWQEALTIDRMAPLDTRYHSGLAAYHTAQCLAHLGNPAAAEPLYRDSLALWESAYGPDQTAFWPHPEDLAILLARKGEFAESERLLDAASEALAHPARAR